MLARQNKGHAAEVSAFVRAVSSRTASPVSLDSAINTTRHVRDRPVARVGRPRPRAVMDTSASHVIPNVPAAITSAH